MASAAIAAGGSIVGSALGGKAAKKAAKTAAKAQIKTAQMNNDLALNIYNQNKGTLAPFVGMGTSAGTKLSDLLNQGPYGSNLSSATTGSALNPGSFDNFKDSTNYDWRMNEGLRGVNTAKWAGGSLHSGDTLKGLVNYSGNLASQEYGNYINQLGDYLKYQDAFANKERAYSTDQYNQYTSGLSGLLGTGLSAAGAQAGVGNTYVNNATANNNQAAAAQSNAALLNGYNQNNMYSNIGSQLGTLLGGIIKPSSGGSGGGGSYGGYA